MFSATGGRRYNPMIINNCSLTELSNSDFFNHINAVGIIWIRAHFNMIIIIDIILLFKVLFLYKGMLVNALNLSSKFDYIILKLSLTMPICTVSL